ncbi:hypothetical protein GEOBC_00142 [Geobacteraceae bacterium]|nr:hypothetical protein GEOBC_00142 [Geobacteraceae bacterium]
MILTSVSDAIQNGRKQFFAVPAPFCPLSGDNR